MTPELSRRVAAALAKICSLDTAGAHEYVRELHRTDPEVAASLGDPAGSPGPPDHAGGDSARGPGPIADGRSEAPTISRAAGSSGPPTEADTGGDAGPPPPPAAVRRLGRYQLVRLVGHGGFGEVWQGYDPLLDKPVAVKVPRPGRDGRRAATAAFLQEARKAASLRHPAIVQVYDVGESEAGWHIVSEFVAGDSLRDRTRAGPLPIDQAVRIVRSVAEALHAAHLAGLVHRDVKPANILLDAAGRAYLTDFGLALREDEQLAERSKVSGTVAYMPPEQIRGDAHLLDGRADIYALGAVLYELLTGRPLYRADGLDEYRELILRREPRPPRSIDDSIPADLERICLKCLAKEVRDRYPTAKDLADDLGAWLAGPAPAPPPATGGPGWVKVAAAGVLAAAVLGGAAGVAVMVGARDRPQPPPADPGRAPRRPVAARPVPTVKPLVWPRGCDVCKWEVLPETNQLKVYTDSTALLRLGESAAGDWELAATLRQLNDTGRVGLFVGYQLDPRTSVATYDLIHLEVVEGQAHLQRTLERYPFNVPLISPDGKTVATAPVARRGPTTALRLVVRDHQLVAVYYNGAALPDLSNVPLPTRADGAYGLFARKSECVASNLVFNERPIPLLADASPSSPETPE